jgi:polynucleotide 5'-hydroxyl-kinase GRC3/NOL9
VSPATEVVLGEGRVLRVVGPARIDVISGAVLAVGSRFASGTSLVVHKYRSYGIKALSETKLRVTLGEGAKIEEAGEGEEVVDEWLKASEQILSTCRRSPCKVLIVGPPDSGKSTFAAFTANYLREAGMRVCVVEGDVGQEDILIPTTIALAEVSRPVLWLRELEALTFRFVGCTSPQYCYSESILAIRELVDEATKMGFSAVLVNTDGWVGTTSGLEHKLSIVRWVRPDVIVTTSRELYEYFLRCLGRFAEIINIPKPAVVRERSREERRELRIAAYRRYLSKGKIRKVRVGDIGLVGACSLCGKPLTENEVKNLVNIPEAALEKAVYSSRFGDSIFLVTKEPVELPAGSAGPEKVFTLTAKDMVGSVVAILGDGMREVGVGVVLGVNIESMELTVLTPWDGEIRGLIVGKVRLTEEFEELGRVVRCTL